MSDDQFDDTNPSEKEEELPEDAELDGEDDDLLDDDDSLDDFSEEEEDERF